jgi:hypothetical protein
LAGIASLPAAVLDLLFGLDVPFDVLLAEGGLVHEGQPDFASWQVPWQVLWRDVLQRADHLYVPDTQAAAFAKRYFPHPNLAELDLREGAAPIPLGDPADDARALGIVALRRSAADHEFIRQVARSLTAKPADHPVVVIGGTLDDLELMKIPNVTVTGAAADEDMQRLLRHHGIKALFVAVRQPLFGHPLVGRLMDSSFPIAAFDWSSAQERIQKQTQERIEQSGLAVEPSLSSLAAAQSVRDWFARV